MLIVPKEQGKCWKLVFSQISDAIKYNSRLSGGCNCFVVFSKCLSPHFRAHSTGLLGEELKVSATVFFLNSGFFTVLTHAVILSELYTTA